MHGKLLTLLAALAVLVAAGGVAAGDAVGVPENTSSDTDSTAGEAGVCVVGAESPCNDDSTERLGEEKIGDSDSGDGQMWIPEDQNRDGEIDDRFDGDGTDDEVGVCVVGAESPCNDDSAQRVESGEKIDDSGDGQMWIPEDQNRDGEIDDRFLPDSPFRSLLAFFAQL